MKKLFVFFTCKNYAIDWLILVFRFDFGDDVFTPPY